MYAADFDLMLVGMTLVEPNVSQRAGASVAWAIRHLRQGGPPPTPDGVAQHLDLPGGSGTDPASFAALMARFQQSRNAITRIATCDVGRDGQVVVVAHTVEGHKVRLRFAPGDCGRAIMSIPQRIAEADLDVTALRCCDIGSKLRSAIVDCFEASYVEGDVDYLAEQLDLFDWIGVACSSLGDVAAFGLAMTRTVDIDRIGLKRLHTPGLSCVRPEARRRGLFAAVASEVAGASLENGPLPALAGARFATPASARALYDHPTRVPRAGQVPNRLHRTVGRSVAVALGVHDFDEETFVCRGPGQPIGQAQLEIDVPTAEWDVFAPVDRSRGDTLLGVVWFEPPPDGW